MTDSKKRRMSMLDSISAAGTPAPRASMMSSNRALRAARNAVDSHHVWELDPWTIEDDRLADRLDPSDVADLRDAIETNGQTVPILVRRHPEEDDRYLLVYGRRRLEAIRQSQHVTKVRALVASMDADEAIRSQISENMARRDLSFIEKAIFCKELIENGFGTQARVAEVMTVSKSAVSMALSIVERIGAELATTIGAAHGVGRPRWEALAQDIDAGADRDLLIHVANEVHRKAEIARMTDGPAEDGAASLAAFEAVAKASKAARPTGPQSRSVPPARSRSIKIGGRRTATVKRTKSGLAIDLQPGAFADWVETEAQTLIEELHARFRTRAED
ncbi:plasmid partitioning protein RepB [Roseobacter sp. HKCCA0434]|uniref:plasmid partitioning protein RepB n=1 Tax=Roseobacter sp. HKCCA0434 TaxID=3079297 RepID=UPI002905A29E|nr:plasmid partitioning protein RepB [Roseobacter sp. HKCCA0434]